MVKRKLLFISVLLILFDQITKILVNQTKPSIDLSIFAINFVHNTGAIWGFFKDSNTSFIWISIIAIGFLIYVFDKIPEKAKLFYFLVFAGIIGNLIDRIVLGYVVDFIDFKFWPVFNFADTFIVIGVIGMIIFLIREKD